jgi:hypothetical protein
MVLIKVKLGEVLRQMFLKKTLIPISYNLEALQVLQQQQPRTY